MQRTHYAGPGRRVPADHDAADLVVLNGTEIIHGGSAWAYCETGTPLDFDACERIGLDGTGRRYASAHPQSRPGAAARAHQKP